MKNYINLKAEGISTVHYKVNDDKFKFNLEFLRKIATSLTAKCGKYSVETKSKITYEVKNVFPWTQSFFFTNANEISHRNASNYDYFYPKLMSVF